MLTVQASEMAAKICKKATSALLPSKVILRSEVTHFPPQLLRAARYVTCQAENWLFSLSNEEKVEATLNALRLSCARYPKQNFFRELASVLK